MKRFLARLAAVSALAAPLLVATGTAPAPAASGAVDDFNGDGYRDLAVGAPDATAGGENGAGAVVIHWGSSRGISATRRTVLTQDSPGIPGGAERWDEFGHTTATADIDRDGRTDLVIGAPGESLGGVQGVGMVTVVWGSAEGFRQGTVVPQPTDPVMTEGGRFGTNLAVGDFTGSFAMDLMVSSLDGAYHYTGPLTRGGTVARSGWDNFLGTTRDAIAGDLDGGGPERIMIPGAVDGDPGGQVYVIEDRKYVDRWDNGENHHVQLPRADGLTGAVGDVNGDGYGDLVLGAPDGPATASPAKRGGQISVWLGGPDGPSLTQRPVTIHQDTPGVPGASERNDRFGDSVAVGDINNDGYADVAVGAPGEVLGGRNNTGMVTVLYGSRSGPRATGSRAFEQDTPGVPGARETDDRFGGALKLSDLNGDKRADLVIGVEGENDWTGAVTVLPGTTGGTSTARAVSWTGAAAGFTRSANYGQAFHR